MDMVTQVVPKCSTSADFPFQKIIQKNIVKKPQNIFSYFSFFGCFEKKITKVQTFGKK
jgi:hypothetical protein